ncbi:DUF4810 domain-containing protein [Testudinibacter sp. P80/BLE/0925]|uniref:DUF4810 domain-containing protein n=1 Tax=Testudinibacter sp. TW-1 TaxID=3417757 RepID=UPI003D37004D
MTIFMKIASKTALVLGAVLLTGCASNNDIYAWQGNDYSKSLYDYLNSNAAETEQIATLESIVNRAESSGKKVPPGLYAQLGLLYSKQGDLNKSQMYFNLEKSTFPEAAQYINFLQNNKVRVK